MKILYLALNNSKNHFLLTILKDKFDINFTNQKPNINILEKYDFIITDKYYSDFNKNSILNYIHPNKLINGSIVSTRKTYTGRIYEKVFGNKLNIYITDKEYPDSIFCKEERQTLGKYWISDEPIWKPGIVNQINYNNGSGVYGIYFVLNELIYSYNYKNSKYYVKYKNVEKIKYYNHKETLNIFGKFKEKLLKMSNLMGLDYGRFDVIMDDKLGPIVIDINSKPFANQITDDDFLKTNIQEEASNIIEKLFINRYNNLH